MVKQLNGLCLLRGLLGSSTFTVKYIELEKPYLFNGLSLETLPQIISLMRKYLFHIPYLARDNYINKLLQGRRYAKLF